MSDNRGVGTMLSSLGDPALGRRDIQASSADKTAADSCPARSIKAVFRAVRAGMPRRVSRPWWDQVMREREWYWQGEARRRCRGPTIRARPVEVESARDRAMPFAEGVANLNTC
jgi:hypothetical protein